MAKDKNKVVNILEKGFDTDSSTEYRVKKAEYRTVYRKKGPFEHLVDPDFDPNGGGGGGEGTTYTAGDGIKIIANVIGVDFNRVQEKLIAGEGVVINGRTISVSKSVLDRLGKVEGDVTTINEEITTINNTLVYMQQEIKELAPTSRIDKDDIDELFEDNSNNNG